MDARLVERVPGFDRHLERLQSFTEIKGRAILEIGSDQGLHVAQKMEELGATLIEATNLASTWPVSERHSNAIRRSRTDMTKLTKLYPPETFDIIFGMAVVEHIRGLWIGLEEAAKVLKPGGILYLHGEPIWTSVKGHHLFTEYNGVAYRFSDRKPILWHWEHLMHDEPRFRKALEARGIEHGLAVHLAESVYRKETINRYGYRRLANIFEKSPLILLHREDAIAKTPNPDQLEKIRKGPWGDEERFEVAGVTHIMRR
jgi:SAM-dependent methyltransferase